MAPPHENMELRFNFKAEIAGIAPIVQRVTRLAQEMHCEPGREMQIALALQEALANAVIHGCESDPSKMVECRVTCGEAASSGNLAPNEMLIVIRDTGGGFDPARVPNPKVGENVHAYHGRGLHLIRELMDEVSFAQGGREIRMRAVLSSLRETAG